MTEPILKAEKLTKTFFKGQPNEVSPVREINLTLEKGAFAVLKGPSGSGKTTLLTILSCLSRPTSGSYFCLGQPVWRWSEKFLTRFRSQYLGIVFQHFNLVEGLSVAQNISLPLFPLGNMASQMEKAVAHAAEMAGIDHRLKFPVEVLSGGELQRVAIARALVTQPDLLLADEPTAHLDSANAVRIMEVFARLKAAGKTIVLSTHDPLVERHLLVDKIFQMKDGQLTE